MCGMAWGGGRDGEATAMARLSQCISHPPQRLQSPATAPISPSHPFLAHTKVSTRRGGGGYKVQVVVGVPPLNAHHTSSPFVAEVPTGFDEKVQRKAGVVMGVRYHAYAIALHLPPKKKYYFLSAPGCTGFLNYFICTALYCKGLANCLCNAMTAR